MNTRTLISLFALLCIPALVFPMQRSSTSNDIHKKITLSYSFKHFYLTFIDTLKHITAAQSLYDDIDSLDVDAMREKLKKIDTVLAGTTLAKHFKKVMEKAAN